MQPFKFSKMSRLEHSKKVKEDVQRKAEQHVQEVVDILGTEPRHVIVTENRILIVLKNDGYIEKLPELIQSTETWNFRGEHEKVQSKPDGRIMEFSITSDIYCEVTVTT